MSTTQMMTPRERITYYKTTMQPLLGTGNERLERHWKYFKEVCPDKAGYIQHGLLAVGSFAGTGGIGGGLAANGINYLRTGTTDPEKHGNGLYAVGITIGVAVGAYFGFKMFLSHVEMHPYFRAWDEKNKEELINFVTFMQYTNDPFLKENICSITQNILVGPCRTPTGYLVEYQMLTQIKKDQEGKITCPFTREKFFDTEIRKDYERALVINKRALYLVEQDLESAKDDLAVKVLLEKQKKFIKESIEECYQNCLLDIEKRRILNLITFEESQTQRNNFVELFGTKSDHPLDWKFDWMDLLAIRWKARFPGEKFFEI